jgi:hypothetical protein
MSHIKLDTASLPSSANLLKATGIAVAVAAVLLVTTVLPAEYGIDPIGIGQRLGLTSLSVEKTPVSANTVSVPTAEASPPLSAAGSDAAWRSSVPYRSDEMSVTLKPNEGTEVKAVMRQGERLVFTWTADGGKVNFDMHGEKKNAAADDFTSYWQGRQQASGHGAFVAPFDGTHGWYWRNRDKQPVTINVKTAGFYEKLYRPK